MESQISIDVLVNVAEVIQAITVAWILWQQSRKS